MKRKTGFSLDLHKTHGQAMKAAYAETQRLFVDACSLYGIKSKPALLASRAMNALDRLRCEMDNIICRENPTESDENTIIVYYGPASTSKAAECCEKSCSCTAPCTSGDHEHFSPQT